MKRIEMMRDHVDILPSACIKKKIKASRSRSCESRCHDLCIRIDALHDFAGSAGDLDHFCCTPTPEMPFGQTRLFVLDQNGLIQHFIITNLSLVACGDRPDVVVPVFEVSRWFSCTRPIGSILIRPQRSPAWWSAQR